MVYYQLNFDIKQRKLYQSTLNKQTIKEKSQARVHSVTLNVQKELVFSKEKLIFSALKTVSGGTKSDNDNLIFRILDPTHMTSSMSTLTPRARSLSP